MTKKTLQTLLGELNLIVDRDDDRNEPIRYLSRVQGRALRRGTEAVAGLNVLRIHLKDPTIELLRIFHPPIQEAEVAHPQQSVDIGGLLLQNTLVEMKRLLGAAQLKGEGGQVLSRI